MMREPLYDRSIEYADNRLSLFSAQNGKCAITGNLFETTEDVRCHHKTPKEQGGTDEYNNLILVTKLVHKLIHATDAVKIESYLSVLNLDPKQIEKVNNLREKAGLKIIAK